MFFQYVYFQKQSFGYVLQIGVLKNFANFTGKHLCWSLFLIKLQAGLKSCNFIKKRIQGRCFPVNFAKFLKAPIFTKHLRWLLLYFAKLKLNLEKSYILGKLMKLQLRYLYLLYIRHSNIVATALSNVTLKLPYSRDRNARRRCKNVSL